MIDIKAVRNNKEVLSKSLRNRNVNVDLDKLINVSEEVSNLQTLLNTLQASYNKRSENMNSTKSVIKRSDLDQNISDLKDMKEDIAVKKQNLKEKMAEFAEIMYQVPNILDESVPYGLTENENKFIKSHGICRKINEPKSHFELGESLNMMDFEQTAKICGSRFVTLKHDLVKLERALQNFMCETNVNEFKFKEISPPFMVHENSMYNTCHLPKFSDDSYKVAGGYRLIPTGEVPIVNMFSDKIFDENELPIRYVGHTACFRSEAGSAGKDTRGMIRLHQFSKVELISATTQEKSNEELEYMLSAAENILIKLSLPYRVVLLCSGDTGFSSSKTYDVEVWFPSQNKYREVSSISNCTDFQSRRMLGRYKNRITGKIKLLHTLNGSALPIGRTLAAVLENYQNSDGSITVPDVLVKYIGKDVIIPEKS